MFTRNLGWSYAHYAMFLEITRVTFRVPLHLHAQIAGVHVMVFFWIFPLAMLPKISLAMHPGITSLPCIP